MLRTSCDPGNTGPVCRTASRLVKAQVFLPLCGAGQTNGTDPRDGQAGWTCGTDVWDGRAEQTGPTAGTDGRDGRAGQTDGTHSRDGRALILLKSKQHQFGNLEFSI